MKPPSAKFSGGGVRYNARLSAKRKLGITEDRMVLAVGQFVHRKGFDVLLQAAAKLPDTIGFYFVGDTAPQEYLQMVEQYRLKNIHFVGFTRKESLKDYYKACDLFVLPTREDIWGLVINEAMTYGLPILSTDRCIAALELVSEGENGWIVPTDDSDALANCIEKWQAMSQADRDLLGWESQKKISSYTIETMAQAHTKWLEEYWSKI